MAASQPIRNKEHARKLAKYFLERGQLRNYVLVVLGLNTAFRIGDLLGLLWDDVYDFDAECALPSITIVEQKTQKPTTVALNDSSLKALAKFAPGVAKPGRFLLESPRTGRAISRVQAYRLLRAAGEALKLPVRVTCHTLRKTLGYHAFKKGVSLAIIMELFNHSSFGVTLRYIGITQEQKDEAFLDLDLIS